MQEAGGLVFAYLGSPPAPLLPRYDLLFAEQGERILGGQEVYCNWLQEAENTVDQAHLPILHAPDYPGLALKRADFHWERDAHGVRCSMELPGVFSKPRLAYYVFPMHNTMASARVGRRPNMFFRYRVPTDDTRTVTYWVNVIPDNPRRERVVGMRRSIPGVFDQIEDDWWGIPSHEQDRMAMETQGPVTDRGVENLASSDRGVLLLREMVREAIDAVEQGRDPFEVMRDPSEDRLIEFDRTLEEMAALAT
jgi:5,5'-dehydrodivanillate O-demethylase